MDIKKRITTSASMARESVRIARYALLDLGADYMLSTGELFDAMLDQRQKESIEAIAEEFKNVAALLPEIENHLTEFIEQEVTSEQPTKY